MIRSKKIRIIGGYWRSRKLTLTPNSLLRPTTNKIRETIFNWITHVSHLQYAHCLDCYAGSGALAIEALSRNAQTVTLLEKNKYSFIQIKKNLTDLGISFPNPQIKIINTNTLSWLSKTGMPFNIVFIDPPFRSNLGEKTIQILEKYKRLTHEAWIYVEKSINSPMYNLPPNWLLYRKGSTRQVSYSLYYRS
ncbi:MAG: 16S rRNA (guanine(966)-N(2))-methyltransferase RsmD [Candidatus Dasytiphilus stammeri]